MRCYEDLIERTSTSCAPWYVIPADHKWYRNLCVARIMVDTLKSLDMNYPEIDWDPTSIVIDGEESGARNSGDPAAANPENDQSGEDAAA